MITANEYRRAFLVVGFLLVVLSLGFGYDLFTAEDPDIQGTRLGIRLCLFGLVLGISLLLAGLGVVSKK